jgi:hypothetical protein
MQRVIKEITVKTTSTGKVYALVTFDAHDDVKKASCWNEDIWKVLYDYYGKPVDLIMERNDKGYWSILRLGTETTALAPTRTGTPPAVTTTVPRPPAKPTDDRAYWEDKNARDNANIRRQVAFKGAIEVAVKNLKPEEQMDIIVLCVKNLTDEFTKLLGGTL